jgi:phosphoglycolate phosphatase-like HAD superfamily hydrolase
MREAVFIGDTMDDCLAARECDLDSIMATYGYGALHRTDLSMSGVHTIDAIFDLRDDGSLNAAIDSGPAWNRTL